MRPSTIRVLTLVISAAVVVLLLTATDVEASSRHVNKHWAAEEVQPVARSWSSGGSACPGNARSIDCRIWPPPFEDDSDRKSGDGGGG